MTNQTRARILSNRNFLCHDSGLLTSPSPQHRGTRDKQPLPLKSLQRLHDMNHGKVMDISLVVLVSAIQVCLTQPEDSVAFVVRRLQLS